MTMVSVSNMQEKYKQVQRGFCFYLELQDKSVSRTLSKRIEDLGLQQEVFLTPRVTHVIRDTVAPKAESTWAPREGARTRADAMLQRIKLQNEHETPETQHKYLTISVQKAILLLDKLYDTFFTAPSKTNVQYFKKHFIKVEILDKQYRPLYKEFDEWPAFSLEPDPIRKESTETAKSYLLNYNNIGQKMTRKSRPRVKEREEKEPKGGYCEMCNTDFTDMALHRRSPHHLAFVRDHTNFLALDTLISAGNDVNTFLEKNAPLNGERRSLRKICNGETEPKAKRSKRSQSPEVNGCSPKLNGIIEDDKKHKTRCAKRSSDMDGYYKVVNTKLRSSAGFVKQKDATPTCNGSKPLVVKFRKVRKSELSVLSDEAEQFMFPKRASSTSSASSDDNDEDNKPLTLQPLERRRLARPVALKEESSEEDSWAEDTKRRRKAPVAVRRSRRAMSRASTIDTPEEPPKPDSTTTETTVKPVTVPEAPTDISPLREDPVEKCMKWEDGQLKYTPAVEQLEFAFESVPRSEPWYETFTRQDHDKKATRNVPRYFALYSKSPKLPYEIGQLPPLKPNCCPLSDLVKRNDKPGPSRSYGTRGLKKQKIRKRTTVAQILALEGHPRKSPREHASTLAILGSVGLLHKRKHPDDTKSTASEDTFSETLSNKIEQLVNEPLEASERLQQFLSEIYEDPIEYEISDNFIESESAAVNTSVNSHDLINLVSECDNCEIIRKEIQESASQRKPRGKRSKFKKKNRTGWPAKKKIFKKSSRSNSSEPKRESSIETSSVEPPDDETTQDSINSEADEATTDIEPKEESQESIIDATTADNEDSQSSREDKTKKRSSRSSASETDEENVKIKRKKSIQALGNWLQPVVRVARVDPNAARQLRSANTKKKGQRNR